MPPDHALGFGAHQHGSGDEILLADRQQLGPHRAGQPGPVEQAEDDGDAEIDDDRAPGHRQRRRQRHPERQFGERAQYLDRALGGIVDPAAVIARQTADHHAEDKADQDAEQTDGQRNPRTVDDAGQHVAPQPIGAEQEQRAARRGTEQMDIALPEAPEFVGIAAAEEADLLDLGRVRRVFALEVFHVEPVVVAVDERPDKPPLMEQVDALRRRIDEIGIAGVQPVGRDDLRYQNRQIHQDQHDARGDRHLVPPQPPPHHAPLRGEIELFLIGGQLLGGLRLERRGADPVGKTPVFVAERLRHRAPPSNRMRGSSAASARSDRNTPTTVSAARNIRNEPARYMS